MKNSASAQNADSSSMQLDILIFNSASAYIGTNMWKSMRYLFLKIPNFWPEKWWNNQNVNNEVHNSFYLKHVFCDKELRNTRKTQKEQKIPKKCVFIFQKQSITLFQYNDTWNASAKKWELLIKLENWALWKACWNNLINYFILLHALHLHVQNRKTFPDSDFLKTSKFCTEAWNFCHGAKKI